MPLKLEQKKDIVAKVAGIANRAQSLVVVKNLGTSVAHMTKLRAEARKVGVYVRVVRNTLAIRALSGTAFEGVADKLIGPILLAFSEHELSAAAKLIQDALKTNEKFEVTAISLGGKVLAPSQLQAVAKLPTKDEAISKLLSVMQAPIIKMLCTMREPIAKLVRTLDAVKAAK